MAGITSSVGLITGIPIQDTVDKLMALAAKPRDVLTSRVSELKTQQAAVNALSTRALGFQFAVDKLKSLSLYSSRTATSSDKTLLNATVPTGTNPPVGNILVRPVRTASSQQLISQRFESLSSAFTSGSLDFKIGGFVNRGVSLDLLNEGAGVQRGKIKITDRSGVSATIDLSFARTVDDVLKAINENGEIAVTASVVGDSFQLVDGSGGSGNLTVAEVSGGTTAAGLGLASVNVAANQATGSDVFGLYGGQQLTQLNDGNGVDLSKSGVADLDVTLSDGSKLAIDLAGTTTLKDVIDKINTAGTGKLSAAIAGDGNRLQITDLTSGSGSLTIADGVASSTATDLGIAGTSSGATITGQRIVSGLGDTLLARLGGGAGVGTLGSISLTDRNGVAASVDLSSVETLGDVIDLINAAAPSVTASFNASGSGLVLTDQSGGTGNLIVANGDATNSADTLGIAVDSAVSSINSGSLEKQSLSRATLLSSLNAGKGVKLGDIRITDSSGRSQTAKLNLSGTEAKTVGDVIDAINALSIGVEARLNERGDGILLVDTAAGTGNLAVKDSTGDVAKSLNLTRASTSQTVDNVSRQVVDGSATNSISLANLATDEDSVLLSTLNGGAGVHLGDVKIFDSSDNFIALDLNGGDAGVTTVGDVIDLINSKAAAQSGFTVTARLNDAGTGILLEDSGSGGQKIKVVDVNSTTAEDLKLAGAAVTVGGKQQINGAGLFASVNGAEAGLAGLAARINDLKAGVTASTVFDGVGYRLSLTVDAAGDANQLLLDATGVDFQFTEITRARDALLLYGDSAVPGSGVLLNSSSNTFTNSIGGLNLTVVEGSDKPVTVNVASSDSGLVTAAQDLVDAYNSLRSDLDDLTSFDPDNLTTGLLFGTREALTLDQRMSRALTDRYFGLGDYSSLENLGISVDDKGKLQLNKSRLQAAYASDPSSVQNFFTDSQRGFVAKVDGIVDSLVDAKTGAFGARYDAIQATIDANQLRIDQYTVQLDKQRERLLLQFTQLESIIGKLQTSQQALANLQIIPPLSSVRSSNA